MNKIENRNVYRFVHKDGHGGKFPWLFSIEML